ncbi:PREDICTED: uncharacterized protein LOC101300189 [Fragaria vesca subsp. vesca]
MGSLIVGRLLNQKLTQNPLVSTNVSRFSSSAIEPCKPSQSLIDLHPHLSSHLRLSLISSPICASLSSLLPSAPLSHLSSVFNLHVPSDSPESLLICASLSSHHKPKSIHKKVEAEEQPDIFVAFLAAAVPFFATRSMNHMPPLLKRKSRQEAFKRCYEQAV